MRFRCTTACLLLVLLSARDLVASELELELTAPASAARAARGKPRYVRAGIEMLGILGAGQIWYWENIDFNRPDFELRWDWPSWKRKAVTFDAVRFDSNAYETNALRHPLEGVLFYASARKNGISPLGSFLATNLGSMLWEYIIEYREDPSLNDMILTPMGGLPLGELAFQLGELWHSRNGIRHRTRMGIAFGGDRAGTSLVVADAELALNHLPSGDLPGRTARWLGMGALTDFTASVSLASGQVDRYATRAEVALGGYAWQRLRADGRGRLSGLRSFTGLGVALDYASHEVGRWTDRLTIINLLGPRLDAEARAGDFRARLSLAGFVDFAMLKAAGLDGYLAEHGDAGLASVISLRHYYYAWGVTLRPRLTMALGGSELGVESSWDAFESIDVRDRYQEQIVTHLHLSDDRLRLTAWAGQRLSASLRLGLGYDWLVRSGSAGGHVRTVSESRFLTRIGVEF